MSSPLYLPSRRLFLASAAVTAVTSPLWTVRGAFAEELTRTPSQTEGPFYPNKLPLDTDNDLLIVNDSITPAVGEVAHLSGRVLDAKGSPIRNALVEIWQCDSHQVYLNTKDSVPKAAQRDKNYLNLVTESLQSVVDQVREALQKGMTLEETRKFVNFDAMRVKFTHDDPELNAEFQSNFSTPIVRQVYDEATEELELYQ